MLKLFTVTIIAAQLASTSLAYADGDCANPKPIFGKVIATCGDQMITYVGDGVSQVLGIKATTSRFELAYCSNGGGRKPLILETNSEGLSLTYRERYTQENYNISQMWGKFSMSGIGYSGEKISVNCTPYIDQRTDIEYLP